MDERVRLGNKERASESFVDMNMKEKGSYMHII